MAEESNFLRRAMGGEEPWPAAARAALLPRLPPSSAVAWELWQQHASGDAAQRAPDNRGL